MAYKKSNKKKQSLKNIETAIAHVNSTFNNTIVTITTLEGDVFLSSSAGRLHKGTKKGTPFAATQVGNQIGKDLYDMGVRSIEVNMKGAGSGRDSVARALQASGIRVTVLRDVTPLPMNGCRAPKKRRV